MPFTLRGGTRLYWKREGEEKLPPLVLLNSIGTDMGLWDACMPHLLRDFQILRMDTRGHGASDAPEGDYTLTELAEDVHAVIKAAGFSRVSVAGVSLGGMMAMELALSHPEIVEAAVLICTSAEMDRKAWADRIVKVRSEGMGAIADLAMGRFLSPSFIMSAPAIAQSLRLGLVSMNAAGYAGAGAAIRDMALIDRLPKLALPVLVVTGTRDVSTPFTGHGERLVDAIPDAWAVSLDAAHLAPLEAPVPLATAIRRFLLPHKDVGNAADTLYEAGLINRRRVLGDEWVDRSLARRTPFNTDFQAMITRIAWQEIWGRPGLDDRIRRLLVVAITASLGRWEEFALHVRAGLSRNGFSQDDLKEVLMQTAIYAGVPAANTGFAEAMKIIEELGAAS
ncbi:bifunctional 3-oxoadipate enol-lactonase/4-carboxymuconolactone decarboxylase PcaDC [Beijerinckia mobilis]|uniref:bifunctional 3-oxoadipate enol-lactonase/4-carboxymuconolactone decarboxylase PcaDC n=1 Tax=Beijerinckia mobilis TaxID=231434 RepID=UPI0005593E2D|nr:3-oxoadipate enol-lactonase [Beijerinckia mobilis]